MDLQTLTNNLRVLEAQHVSFRLAEELIDLSLIACDPVAWYSLYLKRAWAQTLAIPLYSTVVEFLFSAGSHALDVSPDTKRSNMKF